MLVLNGTDGVNKVQDGSIVKDDLSSTLYEEGTFIPTIIGTTTAGVGTYTTQNGTYTKIGRTCFINAVLSITAHTGTGNISIEGLPFVASGAFSLNISRTNLLTYSGELHASTLSGGSSSIYLSASTSNSAYVNVAMDTAFSIVISGTYGIGA